MSIKCSGGLQNRCFTLQKTARVILLEKHSERENFLSVRTEKKRLVRALAEKVFSNREWPVMNRTVCGRYATIKLAYANWVAP